MVLLNQTPFAIRRFPLYSAHFVVPVLHLATFRFDLHNFSVAEVGETQK